MSLVRRLAVPSSSPRCSGRPAARLAAALAVAALATGCAGMSATGKARTPRSAQERLAHYERMMRRENGPFETHALSTLDGFAVGEIESRTAPRPECDKTSTGGVACSFEVDLGADADGDANNIVCRTTTDFQAFGPQLKEFLGEWKLSEVPQLEARSQGEGIAVRFVANAEHEEPQSLIVGTAKFAVLYAHGYAAVCLDRQPGGRRTFERVVGHFFQSLKFKAAAQSPTLFSTGYQERAGDRTTGFRYRFVTRRSGDAPGFSELSAAFSLETDGKTWRVMDYAQSVERDDAGEVASMRTLFWLDGKGPAVLSAKPSEDRKYRLKFEAGQKTDALEASPKAKLSTEFWSAPDLLKVSTGSSPSYRYAILTLHDSDPAFRYVTLTRSKPGVLLEDEETLSSTGVKVPEAGKGEPRSKDELYVDARGLVTKEVSSSSVSELVHTWGELPSLLGGRSDKVSAEASKGTRTSKGKKK
jgi:hypothetical protein